jgi:hypothetical protein
VPLVCLDGQSVPSLGWAYKFLPSKHTETSMWHARSFASTTIFPEGSRSLAGTQRASVDVHVVVA